MSLHRSLFKWAAAASVAAGSLFAAAAANAEVNWSVNIGAPVYYEPAPIYAPPPPPVYYQPPPRVYYRPPPPPVYYRPAPVYYGPPPVYYGPDYRGGHRHRHHDRRGDDDHDD